MDGPRLGMAWIYDLSCDADGDVSGRRGEGDQAEEELGEHPERITLTALESSQMPVFPVILAGTLSNQSIVESLNGLLSS